MMEAYESGMAAAVGGRSRKGWKCDAYSERRNDECKYAEIATQEDMDLF